MAAKICCQIKPQTPGPTMPMVPRHYRSPMGIDIACRVSHAAVYLIVVWMGDVKNTIPLYYYVYFLYSISKQPKTSFTYVLLLQRPWPCISAEYLYVRDYVCNLGWAQGRTLPIWRMNELELAHISVATATTTADGLRFAIFALFIQQKCKPLFAGGLPQTLVKVRVQCYCHKANSHTSTRQTKKSRKCSENAY